MTDRAARREGIRQKAGPCPDGHETNEPMELASPPCYLHEIDPIWSGIPVEGGEPSYPSKKPENECASTPEKREHTQMTELLFRSDSYLHEADAVVLVADQQTGVELDATIFYPQGGGQPGDVGVIVGPNGVEHTVQNTIYSPDRSRILHLLSELPTLSPGDKVRLKLDWTRRYARMKIHTALHLLSVALPYPVTGGAIGDGSGRLDFDIPEADFDKEEIAARVNALIERDAEVTERTITAAELDANPGLVKTMSVQPPRDGGVIRLVEIAGLDLQPCGGTHVRRTGEIGPIVVTAIEKKGKLNRRVRIALL